ncbi:MAG: glycerol-3-phosphate 1-O-acyltransferase PlsY [Candidatus Berkiellales bacterium]
MEIAISILLVVGSYLLGSLSSAILVCRLLHLPDPRREGSGNPGATNVLRFGGRFAALLTLLGDVAKGWLPVFLAHLLSLNPWIIVSTLLAAVCGHIYPIFFQFKGGKGVATLLGGLFGLSIILGAIFIITWIIIFVLFRYSSLAALIAIIGLPFWAWKLSGIPYTVGLSILALIVVWRHKTNIQRLLAGTEDKSSLFKKVAK